MRGCRGCGGGGRRRRGQQHYTYDPFGNAHSIAPDGDDTVDHPFGYTGQLNDSVLTGQLDLRARHCNPATGRFTSRAPYTPGPDEPAVSPYAYVENAPATRVDPNGMCSVNLVASANRDRDQDRNPLEWLWRRRAGGMFLDIYLDDKQPSFMDFFTPWGRPSNPPAVKPDRNRCTLPRSQRHIYRPLWNIAPTGVDAIICPEDLKPAYSRTPRPGTFPDPPGWVPQVQIPATERREGKYFDCTHILGDRFHGKCVPENIFTGYYKMNKSGMRRCENRMAKALQVGEAVTCDGTLRCDGPVLRPSRIIMSARTASGPLFTGVKVENTWKLQETC